MCACVELLLAEFGLHQVKRAVKHHDGFAQVRAWLAAVEKVMQQFCRNEGAEQGWVP